MLEKIDLSKKIKGKDYKSIMSDLEIRLGVLQRQAKEFGIPVIIAFEGWDASGKGTLINQILLALDPRGFSVQPTSAPKEEERLRPFLWRFWTKTPEKGRITIFDRTWYGRVLIDRVDKLLPRKVWSRSYEEIRCFERQLVDDGAVIVKLFLHISQKEQKKRFDKLQSNPSTAWKVNDDDWTHYKQYGEYLMVTKEMLAETDTDFAPWTIIEAHDRRFATVKVFKTIIDAIESKINHKNSEDSAKEVVKSSLQLDNLSSSILDKVDLSPSLKRAKYKKELKEYQQRIRDLEHEMYLKRVPVVIVYEGSDAGGKGGNIRRLVRGLDPRGYDVIPIAAPNDVEKAHHYLWRFWNAFPKAGHIAIFDRSWYGRVMVERIEGFCTQEDWKRAYREINEMEEQWASFGTVLVKFWLQIDKDEQLKRFTSRQEIPYKQWKITDEDWRNREKWDQYKEAVDEMLYRTSTLHAPWTIIEANSKLHARVKALKTVVREVEKAVKNA